MGLKLGHKPWLWIWLVVIIILWLFAARVYNDSRRVSPAVVSSVTNSGITALGQLTISPQDPSLGSAEAGVTVVEWADFACPACAAAAPIIEQFARDHTNQVRLIWKDFIIPSHANSLPAAQAAQCAARQGKFWEYQQGLFINQTQLGSELYLSLANSLDLNVSNFNNCLAQGETLPLINFNQQQIEALGLTETPTLLVNGQLYRGDITAAALANLLPQ